MLRVNCEAVMWKITTRGFTLEEVVIMAVMNLLTSVDRLPNARTGVVEMKRRSRMDLNSIKRTILAAVGVLALSSVNAVAQEIRSEISLQGTGFFTKDADGNGIRQHATDTGGFLLAIATTSIVGLQQRRTTDMTAIRRFISAGRELA